MTLKEKFAPFMYCFMGSGMLSNTQDETIVQWNADKCEKITDEFAIGFAEWVRKETYYEHLTKEFIYKRNVYESEKELLEIYKKENESNLSR